MRATRVASGSIRLGLLALLFLSIGRPCVNAAPIAKSKVPTAAPATSPDDDRKVPMAVTVVPRSKSDAFRDTALVSLDGPIDSGAPDRLSTALNGVNGKIAVWLNSPGGNLYAGMQLGRVIRAHGASTYIINSRTFLAGECYSACAVAFLGGVYRFNNNGAHYGVHRASLPIGSPAGDLDVGHDLSAAVESYIHEMGVDTRLLDLWVKAGPDQMYVLSQQEAKDLRVVNNGRMPPEWTTEASPNGALLLGRQATADGTGTVSFTCDKKQTVFGSVYEAAGKGGPIAAQGWSHVLTVGRYQNIPLEPRQVSSKDGVVRSTFTLTPNLVRLAMTAKRIGHHVKPFGGRAPSIGYSVDIDNRSAALVRKFFGDCLRGQAK